MRRPLAFFRHKRGTLSSPAGSSDYGRTKTPAVDHCRAAVLSECSLNRVLGSDLEFRVIWEVEIHAESPKQAAEQARTLQLNPAMPATIFEVWEHAKQKMHRVDLSAAPEQLSRTELAEIRVALRSLQCSPHLERKVKELTTVMLIFLDAQEAHAERMRRRGYNRAP